MADDAITAGRCDTELAERYEQLRQALLDRVGEGWRLGWGLLVTRGMAAWMRAWADCPPPMPSAAPGVAPPPVAARPGELVAVLAQMALAHA